MYKKRDFYSVSKLINIINYKSLYKDYKVIWITKLNKVYEIFNTSLRVPGHCSYSRKLMLNLV